MGLYNISTDAKGRILLPPEFMALLNADKKVCIVEFGDHIEIWPKEAWDKSQNKVDYTALIEALRR